MNRLMYIVDTDISSAQTYRRHRHIVSSENVDTDISCLRRMSTQTYRVFGECRHRHIVSSENVDTDISCLRRMKTYRRHRRHDMSTQTYRVFDVTDISCLRCHKHIVSSENEDTDISCCRCHRHRHIVLSMSQTYRVFGECRPRHIVSSMSQTYRVFDVTDTDISCCRHRHIVSSMSQTYRVFGECRHRHIVSSTIYIIHWEWMMYIVCLHSQWMKTYRRHMKTSSFSEDISSAHEDIFILRRHIVGTWRHVHSPKTYRRHKCADILISSCDDMRMYIHATIWECTFMRR